MAHATKLRTIWHTVQTAAGLATALVVLVALTPLATGNTAPAMTGVAPTSASVPDVGTLDGQGLRAPADEPGTHQAHIANPQ